MTPEGIYFAGPQEPRLMFFLYDFATQHTGLVAAVTSARLFGHIDGSPDESSLLAVIIEEGNANLKSIEGFR
jgi:hypothetical protein